MYSWDSLEDLLHCRKSQSSHYPRCLFPGSLDPSPPPAPVQLGPPVQPETISNQVALTL